MKMKNNKQNNQPKSNQEIINTSSENLEVLSKKKIAEDISNYLQTFQNKRFETDNYIFDFQNYSKEDENMLLTGQFPLEIFIRLKNKNKKGLDIFENFFDWFISYIGDDLEKNGLKLNFSSCKMKKKDDIYVLKIIVRNW
jgi:hypothetical protein